jgi:hypothetical protein
VEICPTAIEAIALGLGALLAGRCADAVVAAALIPAGTIGVLLALHTNALRTEAGAAVSAILAFASFTVGAACFYARAIRAEAGPTISAIRGRAGTRPSCGRLASAIVGTVGAPVSVGHAG